MNNDILPVVVTCFCGAIIPVSNINHWNASNEEGEEYGVVTAHCDGCKKEYETSQWGSGIMKLMQ